MNHQRVLLTFGVLTLVLLSTTFANASRDESRGYPRPFDNGHQAGNACGERFTDHPLLQNTDNLTVSERFVADASFYGNRLFHNRNPMASGNPLHECDATVVAYNSLPMGTIIRVTNPANDISIYVVVQDRGGPLVTHRPDLARGGFESLLSDGQSADQIGVHRDLIFEVMVPSE
jgi:hypothetical protein